MFKKTTDLNEKRVFKDLNTNRIGVKRTNVGRKDKNE